MKVRLYSLSLKKSRSSCYALRIMAEPTSPVRPSVSSAPVEPKETPDRVRQAAALIAERLKAGIPTPQTKKALVHLSEDTTAATPGSKERICRRVQKTVRTRLGRGAGAKRGATQASLTLKALHDGTGIDVGPFVDEEHVEKRHARPSPTETNAKKRRSSLGIEMARLHRKPTTFFGKELTGKAAQTMLLECSRIADQGKRVLYKHPDGRYFVGLVDVAPSTFYTMYPIFYAQEFDSTKTSSILADGSLTLSAADVKKHAETLIEDYKCWEDFDKKRNPIKFVTMTHYWVDIASQVRGFPFPTGIYIAFAHGELAHIDAIALKASWR